MVLGYADPDNDGIIETWYSAGREVIQTQNGRIVKTAGLETDWISVRYPDGVPAWDSGPRDPRNYTRFRDQMPGYAFALSDTLSLRHLDTAPFSKLPFSLSVEQAKGYKWFEERIVAPSGGLAHSNFYAVGLHRGETTVVYSQQCLNPSFCLKMQRWPVSEVSP
jgi:hypothetical protein